MQIKRWEDISMCYGFTRLAPNLCQDWCWLNMHGIKTGRNHSAVSVIAGGVGRCHTDSFRRSVTARFVTRFNLWLRHDLWPHNASICDPARFVTKSASICDQRYTMILESKLCRGKLVFVFTLIMYTKWYNMIIYIYELWYDAYINSGARSLMLFTLILF